MKAKGIEETCLQLLQNVSGMFRPGVLTALVGVSGAGKTTLMNVLAERKIGGYTDESIIISDYPKPINFCSNKCYCEKNYIHSPHVTVYESLIYLAWLCFSPYVKMETRKTFLSEEAIDDVWLVASYLSNADFLRSSLTENLSRDCGAENIIQLAYFSCCRGTNCTRS